MEIKPFLVKSSCVPSSLNNFKIRSFLPHILLCFTLTTLIFSGCATNPVTGKHELRLISDNSEISTGRKQYKPGKQMEGGEYICDTKL
ncbi:MAG: hypothetical protein GY857_17585, partial [Desulfobacula sp.]|nr:hypothetical protein [Desulfobacula sp.]